LGTTVEQKNKRFLLLRFRIAAILSVDVNSKFEPLRTKTDRMGLGIRKSLRRKALRILSAESIVTKRVALAEPFKSSEFPRVRFNREAED
jgi:hypothetical protein